MLPYQVKVTSIVSGLTSTEMTSGRNFSSDDMTQIEDFIKTVDYLFSLGVNAFVVKVIDCVKFEINKERAILDAYMLA